VQESWIKDHPHYAPITIGSKVWLEGTNLRLPANATTKLTPRRYRPFVVATQVSKVAYQLCLPSTWKIHDIFHVSLLTPYKETDQHGPNFIEPPPDILEGEEEWEVEKILKEHSHGRWKKKQYLIRWKGYSPAHNSWVNAKDLHASDLLAEFQRHPPSIRTLSLNKTNQCQTTTPQMSSPHLPQSTTSYTMTALSLPIPTSIETPSTIIQLSTTKENLNPPSSTLSVQLAKT